MMTGILRAILAASSVAAMAVWVRHAYRSRAAKRTREPDEFEDLYQQAEAPIEIDDDAAADIIRRAQPALERARQEL